MVMDGMEAAYTSKVCVIAMTSHLAFHLGKCLWKFKVNMYVR